MSQDRQLQTRISIPKNIQVLWQQENQLTQPLLIKGQGVADIILNDQVSLTFELNHPADEFGLKLEIQQSAATLYERITHHDFGKTFEEWSPIKVNDSSIAGIDSDKNCRYWFSIDGPNNRISYGKGEMRQGTTLLEHHLSGEQLKLIDEITIITQAPNPKLKIWREPVTIDPSLNIVGTNELTMTALAANTATVAANLTPACQTIYANISGNQFKLDTEDFPHFAEAIEQSIQDPEGWCYKTLHEKAEKDEFGSEDPFAETYLRITLGVNQGDSPGIPNVLEIWPPGHHSPIHNHGDANAIIRVLQGEIQVDLYAMLSPKHTDPFATKTFNKHDVTWLSPGLNQIHKLTNPNLCGPSCMTIQSYMYSGDNDEHYEFFDFIDGQNHTIEPFSPNSDMGFIEFKATMKEEWLKRNN